jgi:lysophospholipase L1-like esterase
VIRVACVGDSITQGVHVGGEDNYPSALQQLLGARYEVRTFGYLCGTVMNIKDRPYMATPEFKKATNYNPHIVIFMLGTNDSKPGEWKQKHGFKTNAFRKFIAIRI